MVHLVHPKVLQPFLRDYRTLRLRFSIDTRFVHNSETFHARRLLFSSDSTPTKLFK